MLQFLNPLLLWGMTAAAVPIVIHLLNRRRFERQRWAAMAWLLQAVQQHKRRLRLESLLLLLLRTLAILLLALAIARPHLSETPLALGATKETHLFLVIDNSGSMGARSGLRTALEEATATAGSLLGEISSDDPVTLVLTNDNVERHSGRPHVYVRETRDHAKVRRVLGELRPAPVRADLGETLKIVDEAVSAGGTELKKIAILTDVQRVTLDGPRVRSTGTDDPARDALRTHLESLAGKGAEVIVIPAGKQAPNVAIVGLAPEERRDIVQGAAVTLVAQLVNYSDRPERVEVRFLVDGETKGDEDRGDFSAWVELPARPAGTTSPPSRPHRFVLKFDEDELGPHSVEARIVSDALTADDARSFAFEVRPPIKVLAVDGDPTPPSGSGEVAETYWLRDTLALKDKGPISVTVVEESEYASMRSLDEWDLVVLANVGRPARGKEEAERLESYVRRGGALLLTVGNKVTPDAWNRELWRDGKGLLPARLKVARVQETPWLKFDLGENRHPILHDLTDPANATLFQSPIQRGFMELEGADLADGTGVVLRYTDLDSSPALVERRFGKGRVLLLTTTIDDAWGDLPGRYLYPALLHETVYVLTSRGNADRNLVAYQPYTRTFPPDFGGLDLSYPDGSPAPVDVETPPDAPAFVTFSRTEQLGVYRSTVSFKAPSILSAAPQPQEDVFTVGMSPLESDLARVPTEEVAARWPELLHVADSLGMAADTVSARKGDISRQFLLAALLCLLAEVALARHIGRSRTRAR